MPPACARGRQAAEGVARTARVGELMPRTRRAPQQQVTEGLMPVCGCRRENATTPGARAVIRPGIPGGGVPTNRVRFSGQYPRYTTGQVIANFVAPLDPAWRYRCGDGELAVPPFDGSPERPGRRGSETSRSRSHRAELGPSG